jgi:hypothetical protein
MNFDQPGQILLTDDGDGTNAIALCSTAGSYISFNDTSGKLSDLSLIIPDNTLSLNAHNNELALTSYTQRITLTSSTNGMIINTTSTSIPNLNCTSVSSSSIFAAHSTITNLVVTNLSAPNLSIGANQTFSNVLISTGSLRINGIDPDYYYGTTYDIPGGLLLTEDGDGHTALGICGTAGSYISFNNTSGMLADLSLVIPYNYFSLNARDSDLYCSSSTGKVFITSNTNAITLNSTSTSIANLKSTAISTNSLHGAELYATDLTINNDLFCSYIVSGFNLHLLADTDLILDTSSGDIKPKANIIPNTSGTYDLGSDTKRFNRMYTNNLYSSNIGVGISSPQARIHAYSDDYVSGAYWNNANCGLLVGDDTGGTSTAGLGLGYKASTNTAYIEAIAPYVAWKHLIVNTKTYTVWEESDERMKSDIADVNAAEIRDKFKKLKFKKYHLKDSNTDYDYGFLASDVEQIFPEFVEQKSMNKMVNYTGLLKQLFGVVQNLIEEIDEMKTKNSKLTL